MRLAQWIAGLTLVAACSSVPPPENVASDPQDEKATSERAIQAPAAPDMSPTPGTPAGGSDQAQGGRFQSSKGAVDLAAMWQNKGLVVVFYRGHWCKQCQRQLSELQAVIKDIRGRGYDVVGISTDEPSQSDGLTSKLGLDFSLLSDKGGLNSTSWGVYSKEFDMERPSVFVIRPGGTIAFRYVSDTPSDRPSVEQLMEVIIANPPPG